METERWLVPNGHESGSYETILVSAGLLLKFTIVKLRGLNKQLNNLKKRWHGHEIGEAIFMVITEHVYYLAFGNIQHIVVWNSNNHL